MKKIIFGFVIFVIFTISLFAKLDNMNYVYFMYGVKAGIEFAQQIVSAEWKGKVQERDLAK